jgi:hypothetical protein
VSEAGILELSIGELSARLSRREVSSEQATRAALARIEATDARLGAFLRVTPERALSACWKTRVCSFIEHPPPPSHASNPTIRRNTRCTISSLHWISVQTEK